MRRPDWRWNAKAYGILLLTSFVVCISLALSGR